MNIFQVIEFDDKGEKSSLKLKYIVPPEGRREEEKNQLIEKDPHYSELTRYLDFQKRKLSEIKNQGDVFFHNRFYEEAVRCFDEYEKRQGSNIKDYEFVEKEDYLDLAWLAMIHKASSILKFISITVKRIFHTYGKSR